MRRFPRDRGRRRTLNSRFAQPGEDAPIRYIKESLPLPELVRLVPAVRDLYRVVAARRDESGRQEFVAAREDLDGVPHPERDAGAAQELHEALIINPYAKRGFADAVERAVVMPSWEPRPADAAMRRRVAGRDVLAWASTFSIASSVERQQLPGG